MESVIAAQRIIKIEGIELVIQTAPNKTIVPTRGAEVKVWKWVIELKWVSNRQADGKNPENVKKD